MHQCITIVNIILRMRVHNDMNTPMFISALSGYSTNNLLGG